MYDWTSSNPRWVDAILQWRWVWPVARVALVAAFVIGGLTKLIDFPGAIVEQEHFGLHPGWLWAALAIVVELGGSALVIVGRVVWLGAGAIGVLTAIAMLVANDFWTMEGHARFVAMNSFFEHLGLIAGLVLAALMSAQKLDSEIPKERRQGAGNMYRNKLLCFVALVVVAVTPLTTQAASSSATPAVAVGPQYDTTHVYVAAEDFDRFVNSVIATFGGTKSQQGVFQVTPTPSQTISQLVLTPVGTLSVFGFKTPIPYPFGIERTGYLVTDMDAAVKSASEHGADVTVAIFPDPIGSDAIIEWPGGVHMQIYWHTTPPNYAALESVPENRVYVSPGRADVFVRDFVAFSHGKVTSDVRRAPGVEIGRPKDTFRRIRVESKFGKLAVFVTDGQLPYPFGREMTGYEVMDLDATLTKAMAAGGTILVGPFASDHRRAAIIQFPGGYIAEIHTATSQ
jgi:uncharacterized membrane protein YphA (DoxX/SURF4 family)/predicted enzyme related to lactoylglutathione lyase